MQVAQALRELDVTHRCYKVRKISATSGQLVEHVLPAYSGYVFTYANDVWYHQIKKVDGVLKFLSFDPEGYPTPISQYEIARLDALADANLVFGTYDPTSPVYKKGDHIRILAGPFVHFTGTFIESLKFACICEIDIFGRKTRVTLGFHQIEATQERAKQRKHRSRRINKHKHLYIAGSTPD